MNANPGDPRVGSSGWLAWLWAKTQAEIAPKFRRLCLGLLILRNDVLILLLKLGYRFCLARKNLILFVRRCLIRFSLFNYNRKLCAKYGRNWRTGTLNYECVQFLEVVDYCHKVMYGANNQAEPRGQEDKR